VSEAQPARTEKPSTA